MPAGWPSAVLKRHCALLREQRAKYQARWIERTRPFLARVVPADLPKSVVYPFGGGDLVTALATLAGETAGALQGLLHPGPCFHARG